MIGRSLQPQYNYNHSHHRRPPTRRVNNPVSWRKDVLLFKLLPGFAADSPGRGVGYKVLCGRAYRYLVM